MRVYNAMHAVKMEDLNHHQNLYAGKSINWLVEIVLITIIAEHGDPHGVLFKNCHKFSFNKSVWPGQAIDYRCQVVRVGRTSATMRAGVYDVITGEEVAEGYITFVTVESNTNKPIAHNIVLDETDDPDVLKWRAEANSFFEK